jgi:uncharacterized membrane protein YgaE (UPF0421/DUF939 family)
VDRPSRSRPVGPYVDLVVARGRTSLRARLDRLRSKSWQIGQCAVAAGVAWWLATTLLGHEHPYFAPIVALVSLGTSYGQRLRRVAEVTVGVAVGVFLGDLYTHVLGRGPWQITVMIGLAMVIALLLDASPLLVNQVAIQSLVVVTVLPNPDAAFLRWTDALMGGLVALAAASVVPAAPLRRPREQAALVVRKIGALLRASADSIDDGDVERARATLADARTTDTLVGELRAAADEGLSVVASSPFRLRHRGGLRRLGDLVEPLDFALRNTRVLARRIAVANHRGEPIPGEYAAFLRELADISDRMAAELAARRMATAVQEPLVELGRRSATLPRSQALSAEVVLAQLRSLLADLLAVTGVDPLAATDLIPPL